MIAALDFSHDWERFGVRVGATAIICAAQELSHLATRLDAPSALLQEGAKTLLR